jgi:hypothetical protein
MTTLTDCICTCHGARSIHGSELCQPLCTLVRPKVLGGQPEPCGVPSATGSLVTGAPFSSRDLPFGGF